MKKLILSGSALLLSLSLANAQAGWGTDYIYDDFAQEAPYTNEDGTGIYWYSYPNATDVSGTRNATAKTSTFSFATPPAYCVISANFGSSEGVKTPIDLTDMADIEVRLENGSSAKDLVMRVYLEDVNGVKLFIEPNISDCVDAPDFGTPTDGIEWGPSNLVYPTPTGYPGDKAVYPSVAFNGFVVPKSTTKTYKIDLSSVPGSVGGRFTATDFTDFGNTYPGDSPSSVEPATAEFDITQVHVVNFQFNEGIPLTLSDNSTGDDSYLYDAKAPAQSDFSGNVIFHSVKVGNAPITAIRTDAAVNASLNVYPNPAKDQLTVKFESSDNATVSLTDIVGNQVYSASAVSGSENRINVASYPKGVYLLTVTTEKGKAARRVSIQ